MCFRRKKSYINSDGYKQVYAPKSPYARENGYAPEHRIKAEKMMGRQLRSNEVVHHKDGNKLNNKKSNLAVMTRSDHYKEHNKK